MQCLQLVRTHVVPVYGGFALPHEVSRIDGGLTHVVPIYEGSVLPHAISRIDGGVTNVVPIYQRYS